MKVIKYIGIGLGLVTLIYCGLPTLLAFVVAGGAALLSVLVVIVPYGLLIVGSLWCLYTVGRIANWMYRKKYSGKGTTTSESSKTAEEYKKDLADLKVEFEDLNRKQ